jgi:hypothetical protein
MQRRYSDAVEGGSMASSHILWMLIVRRQKGQEAVALSRLLEYVRSTGRDDWTETQVSGYMDELVRNRCVEVRTSPDAVEDTLADVDERPV